MSKLKRFSRRYVASQAKKKRTIKLHGLKNHPFVIPVITFIVLFFISSVGFVLLGSQTVGPSDLRVVRLSVDGGQSTVPTRAKTVDDLLERLNIQLNENDIVEPKLTTKILEDDFSINIYKARPVTIEDNGRRITVLSAHRQNRTIVQNAGIALAPEDGIKESEVTNLTKQDIIGEKIIVDRAKDATINLYGNIIPVKTRASTVGDLLNQKNIKTLEGDTVEPARNTAITKNTQIFIVRTGKKIITSEEAIPAPITYEDEPNLAIGANTVKIPGSAGKKLVTYEIELKNNQEVSRKVLQEVIASAPVTQVVARGTKVLLTGGKAEWMVAAGLSPADYAAADYIISKESGWCPTKWQGEYGACPPYHGTPTSAGVGYGLCQATPGYKMASAGADWGVNPVTQLKWCTGYARNRYGSWQAAYNFWVVNRWW
jgi:uncharacterized protein YabE (DUF348 family)